MVYMMKKRPDNNRGSTIADYTFLDTHVYVVVFLCSISLIYVYVSVYMYVHVHVSVEFVFVVIAYAFFRLIFLSTEIANVERMEFGARSILEQGGTILSLSLLHPMAVDAEGAAVDNL